MYLVLLDKQQDGFFFFNPKAVFYADCGQKYLPLASLIITIAQAAQWLRVMLALWQQPDVTRKEHEKGLLVLKTTSLT